MLPQCFSSVVILQRVLWMQPCHRHSGTTGWHLWIFPRSQHGEFIGCAGHGRSRCRGMRMVGRDRDFLTTEGKLVWSGKFSLRLHWVPCAWLFPIKLRCTVHRPSVCVTLDDLEGVNFGFVIHSCAAGAIWFLTEYFIGIHCLARWLHVEFDLPKWMGGPGWVEQRPDLFVEKLPMRSELGTRPRSLQHWGCQS